VLQAEDEPTRPVRPQDGVEEEDPALVLERGVVDLPVEQVDLVARGPGVDDPVVGAVLLLALPEQEVAAEVVLVLGQRLLLDPGDEKDDDLLALGGDDAPADRVVRLVASPRGQLGPRVLLADRQEGHVHEAPPPRLRGPLRDRARPLAL
jgi:hypothetical protein